MAIPQEDIATIVAEVISRLGAKTSDVSPANYKSGDCGCNRGGDPCGCRGAEGVSQPYGKAATGACSCGSPSIGRVVFPDVDSAVRAAEHAQHIFQALGLEARRHVIGAMRGAAVKNAEKLARLAVDETGMGRYEDKVQKNIVCAKRTPGTEDLITRAYTGDKGLTMVEWGPFGVVAAVTPSTNPAATIINNSISILAGGNSVVFAPHPAAKKTCIETMRILEEAACSAGAPPNLITTIAEPTQETTKALLSHPIPRVNMVTGGPAIVKVAMTAGKSCKTIAAGPGNPPAVVDETAQFPKCAQDIIFGASFDNCVLCTGEKEVIVTAAARDRFLSSMRGDSRAFELTASQMQALAKVIIVEGGKGCKDPRLNRDYIGKDAAVIAKKALGLDVPPGVRLLWGEVANDDPWIWTEQLMPILPVTVARDVDAAIELAVQAEGGNRHTASMHSMNIDHLTRMARRMQCSIYVKNAPNIYGLGLGEGYATMSIGTPTGDGLTKASHFVRPLHCSLVGYFRIA